MQRLEVSGAVRPASKG